MDSHWNDNQPIYRQLRDKVVAMILEGTLADGDALPSVRNVAADFTLNPLTVLKGYQQLVDEGLVEKRRGRGMFVTPGRPRAAAHGRAAAIPRAGVAPRAGHDRAARARCGGVAEESGKGIADRG